MNPNVERTLDDCVAEVLGLLTGLELGYVPAQDRYRSVTRALNRALRLNALETEWSYYSDLENIGPAIPGVQEYALRKTIRPRQKGDDAVVMKDEHGVTRVWAYFMTRDALHKYAHTGNLVCNVTRNSLMFSRPLGNSAAGLTIFVPVMREPRMFELPKPARNMDPELEPEPEELDESYTEQLCDFDYPDVIIARAAFIYAQTDPLYQPRAVILEDQWKDLMYALTERDTNVTDSPYINDFVLPISNSIDHLDMGHGHLHPHTERWG